MKTNEELKALKEEYDELSNKLKDLTEDELKLVTGGVVSEAKERLKPIPID